jgi:hypothetical protein
MAAKAKAQKAADLTLDTTEVDQALLANAGAETESPAKSKAAAHTVPASAPKDHSYDYTKLNSLAVVAFATSISWVGALAGIITGHIALAQIKRSGEKGRALAVTGLVLGYLYVVGAIAFSALMILFRMRGWVDGQYYGPGSMGGYTFRNDNDGTGMMNFNR